MEDALCELRRESISSPRMDGMPKGSGEGDQMPRRMARIDDLTRRIERQRARLSKLRRSGERAIYRLEAREKLFVEAYYLRAEKAGVAAILAQISDKSASRYIRRIERA